MDEASDHNGADLFLNEFLSPASPSQSSSMRARVDGLTLLEEDLKVENRRRLQRQPIN
jgi:hypothetical protein